MTALFACVALAWADVAPARPPAMQAGPRVGDHTLLSWREGAPYITNARPEDVVPAGYSSERRILRLETGWYAADIDTERVTISGFAPYPQPRDAASAERAALAAEPLPGAKLHLAVVVGEKVFTCTGRRPLALDGRGQPKAPLAFPVRVIESGRFFQHLGLFDLEFRDPAGNALAATAHVEIAAWPDRFGVTLAVTPHAALAGARAEVRLETGSRTIASIREPAAVLEKGSEHRLTLTLDAQGAARAATTPEGVAISVLAHDPKGGAKVRWSPEETCYEVALDAPPWPWAPGETYPVAMLDALESYDLGLANATDAPRVVALKFTHSQSAFAALTGTVPMLLDARGNPTGIPVQVSKNWHVAHEAPELRFAGRWIHGRTWLVVPPRTRFQFQYAATFARWGGVPTASHAQLSLVGWGHNGFWDQLALGSFGESICFQPLRVQRRSLFTDLRPLYQLGMTRGERFTWTSNVGAVDTWVLHDTAGRYVPFKRNVTRYESHGPNLAELHYAEVSKDEAVRGRVEVRLPRTDDHVRVYLRIRYDVDRPVAFSRLALFQLGADFYNSGDATRLALGDVGGLVAELEPGSGRPASAPLEIRGAQPWVSLHGQPRNDTSRTGQGTRGIIVREWKARLGGREVDAPWWVANRGFAPTQPLGADLVPPPDVKTLRAGDYVDLLAELIVLPIAAERYYGPDDRFREALVKGANTWGPIHREALENQPVLTLGDGRRAGGFPLVVPLGSGSEVGFELEGGLGWIPIRFTGLVRPDGLEVSEVTRSGIRRLSQGPAGRAFWQVNQDGAGWSVTYNLPAPLGRTRYVAAVKASAPEREREIPARSPAR